MSNPNAIRNQVWFDTLSTQLGTTQLTHAVARVGQLERMRERNEDLLELLRQISICAARDGDGPFMLSPALVEAAHAAVEEATKRA